MMCNNLSRQASTTSTFSFSTLNVKKMPNMACMSAVRDFMGLRSDKLQIYDVPSGINVVPLTIAEPSGYSEEASLAAGVTGYKV